MKTDYKDRKCKHCGVIIYNCHKNKLINHSIWCDKNPNVEILRKRRSDKRTLNKVVFTKKCLACNKKFSILRKVDKNNKIKISKKEAKCCSKKCAKSIGNKFVDRNKLKEIKCIACFKTLLVKWNRNKNTKCEDCSKQIKNCIYCGLEFNALKKTVKFCSKSCSSKNFANSKEGIECLRNAGRKSAQSQNKRSKNEVYFYELCKQKFKNVEHNKPIFNGWDADIIIHDIKTAVLWNGKWHYEKITKKHSLSQVQSRDKIKLDQIKLYGYTPYIIKDMGKYDKIFVEQQFEIFKLLKIV